MRGQLQSSPGGQRDYENRLKRQNDAPRHESPDARQQPIQHATATQIPQYRGVHATSMPASRATPSTVASHRGRSHQAGSTLTLIDFERALDACGPERSRITQFEPRITGAWPLVNGTRAILAGDQQWRTFGGAFARLLDNPEDEPRVPWRAETGTVGLPDQPVSFPRKQREPEW